MLGRQPSNFLLEDPEHMDWLDSAYSRELFRRVGVDPSTLPLLAGIAEDGADVVIWFNTDGAEVRFRGAAAA
jgi:hypothetical protein